MAMFTPRVDISIAYHFYYRFLFFLEILNVIYTRVPGDIDCTLHCIL